jgi:hypothetical protein
MSSTMNKALWSKKALALPACAAIVIGGITLVATPANADPADLSITSQSVTGRVLTVNGTGTPGENIQLDEDFRNTRHAIGTDGKWTITYTIPGTDYASNTYTIEQLKGLNQDGSKTITAAAQQPVQAFAIKGQSVTGRVLTVTGVGDPADTVNFDVGYPVTRTPIKADGTWSISYTIPGTDTVAHTYTINEQRPNLSTAASGTVTASAQPQVQAFAIKGQSVSGRVLTVNGVGDPADTVNFDVGYPVLRTPINADGTWTISYTIPGTDTDAHTYTINEQRANLSTAASGTVTARAEAATPVSTFSLTTPKDGSTVSSRTVTFTGTGTPGDLVNVLDADGNRAAPQVLVAANGTWTTTGTFSDSAAQVQDLSVNQIGGAQGQGNIEFTITLPAVAVVPGAGNPGTGNPGTGTPVTGAPVAGTPVAGNGPATGVATGIGKVVGTLPVVSG